MALTPGCVSSAEIVVHSDGMVYGIHKDVCVSVPVCTCMYIQYISIYICHINREMMRDVIHFIYTLYQQHPEVDRTSVNWYLFEYFYQQGCVN